MFLCYIILNQTNETDLDHNSRHGSITADEL